MFTYTTQDQFQKYEQYHDKLMALVEVGELDAYTAAHDLSELGLALEDGCVDCQFLQAFHDTLAYRSPVLAPR